VSRFHVLRDKYPAVPRASVFIFMFCAPGLIFGGTEGVGSCFYVLRARTRFRRYRGSRVPFSSFARPYPFLAVSRASTPLFEVLRARTHFRRYRGRQLPFLKFCAPGPIFGGTEGDSSRFQVLRSPIHFRRCRVRWLPYSCFAHPDSFSAVPRASGPIFMFCAPRLVFDGTEGVVSRFHVLCPDLFPAVLRASVFIFMFCSPGHVFGGTKGVGSRLHVLRVRTHFRRYRGRRLLFSCFVLPDSFSAALSASGPVFIFFAPGLVFDGTEGVGSHFQVLRSPIRFQSCRVRWLSYSCFAHPDSFSAVSRASGPIFMFCATRLVFDGTEGVMSRFHVLRAQTRFRRYRGRRFSFSCFARPDMFLAVPRALGPVFMFCATELIFGGTEGVGSRFHVLCSRTRFRRCRVCRVPFYVFRSWTRFRRYRGNQILFSCFALPDSFSAVPRASGPVFMF
jgi:hypothetical protein